MPDLNDDQKTLIVTRLACYASPKEIAAEFEETFGETLKSNQIAYYDPFSAQGSQQLDKKWKDLFWKIRKQYDATLAKVPIANLNYRLLLLNRIASDPTLGKTKLGLKAMEQVAKEVGGMYRREAANLDVDEQIESLMAELVAARQTKAPEAPQSAD